MVTTKGVSRLGQMSPRERNQPRWEPLGSTVTPGRTDPSYRVGPEGTGSQTVRRGSLAVRGSAGLSWGSLYCHCCFFLHTHSFVLNI